MRLNARRVFVACDSEVQTGSGSEMKESAQHTLYLSTSRTMYVVLRRCLLFDLVRLGGGGGSSIHRSRKGQQHIRCSPRQREKLVIGGGSRAQVSLINTSRSIALDRKYAASRIGLVLKLSCERVRSR